MAEGFLIAYEITETHFRLRLLRLIPLARIRLDEIQYIRQRSGEGMGGLLAEVIRHPFHSLYWPHPLFGFSRAESTAYVIRMTSGRRVFVRLRTGFHYRLRAAMGRARAGPDE